MDGPRFVCVGFRNPLRTRGAPLGRRLLSRSLLWMGTLSVLTSTLAFAQCQPQACAEWWLVDGPVNALLLTNRTAYLGGDFTYIGPRTGSAVLFDLPGMVRLKGFPVVDGIVWATESDGSGGWFLGGQFTRVGRWAVTNLVHIRGDLQVDVAWKADVTGTAVYALAVSGDRLYVGGQFQRIAGTAQRNLAAVHPVDASLHAWNPDINGTVYRIHPADGLVYVGGTFNHIGSSNRANLAAIDAGTALATAWNPSPDRAVLALQVAGSTVYAGGQFTSAGTKPRNYLVALDRETGIASNWNPNPNAIVRALEVTDDAVYVGGDFTTISVQNRRGFAGVRRSNGSALPVDLRLEPGAGSQPLVSAIKIINNTVAIGGSFARVQGTRHPVVVAFDLATGELVASPLGTSYKGSSDDATVLALAATRDQVLVAGSLVSLGGLPRTNAAALSTVTGEATEWSPNLSGPVMSLASCAGAVLVGGAFTNCNDAPAPGLAAVDGRDGVIQSHWDFMAVSRFGNPNIRSLHVASEDRLFIGGQFDEIGNQSRFGLAAIHPVTGQPIEEFNASLSGGSQGVIAMAGAGDTLFLAGDFNRAGGQARSRLAAVSLDRGIVRDWNPAPNREVSTLSATTERLYVGGSFTRIADIDLRGLAVFDLASLALLPWDASLPHTSYSIAAVAAQETVVYTAGQFDSIGGEFRLGVAALGPFTAQAHDWNPAPAQTPSLIVLADDWVCLGGTFRTLGTGATRQSIGYLAAFGRGSAVTQCTISDGKLRINGTTGDRACAVLQASTDLKTWTNTVTNDLPGYSWNVEQSAGNPWMFFRIAAQ